MEFCGNSLVVNCSVYNLLVVASMPVLCSYTAIFLHFACISVTAG